MTSSTSNHQGGEGGFGLEMEGAGEEEENGSSSSTGTETPRLASDISSSTFSSLTPPSPMDSPRELQSQLFGGEDKQSHHHQQEEEDEEEMKRKEEEKERARINQGSLTPADSTEDSEEDDDEMSSSGGEEENKIGGGGRRRMGRRSRSNSSSSSASIHERWSRAQESARNVFLPSTKTLTNLIINTFSIGACLLIFGIFLLGSYDYFKNVEENKCDMTWMYRRPYFVNLKLGNGLDERFPSYKLFAYTEGEKSVEVMSREDFKFTGIPVLFIPGNSGSHQQVRSLGSVALWKYLDAGTPFHFDFFSLDLNEEFSALYGYSLQRQVEFAKEALVKIVNLYEEFHKVVVVGHSMGGVVAKAVALDEDGGGGGSLTNLILTLATPHQKPVMILDPELDMFYYGVRRNWTRMISQRGSENAAEDQSTSGENQITLVSIAGGDRDYQVLPKYTRWNPYTTVHTITTAVPGVWASTDHLCIVWCKQLVLTLVRSLFDLVEFHPRNKYYHVTDREDARKQVLEYHLLKRSSGKSTYGLGHSTGVTLQKNVEQVESETDSGIFCRSSGQRPTYVLYSLQKILEEGSHDKLLVLSTNTKDKHWIMGCRSYMKEEGCTQAESLSSQGEIIPHVRRRRKRASLTLQSLSKYSHLIIKMEPHQFKTCVIVETFRETERKLLLGGSFHSEKKSFYNLTLDLPPTFGSVLAWRVEAFPAEVNGGNWTSCPNSHNLLAQFNHGPFQQSRFLKNESLVVRFADWNVTGGWVGLYLEPTCNYTIVTKLALLESAGQFFRMLMRYIPSFYASIILMTLYFQEDPENWGSFHGVLLGNAYHLSVFPGFCVAVALHFVPTDWPLMVDEREYSVVVPFFLYMIAYCMVLLISSATWYFIITGGTAIHTVVLRLLSTRFGSWLPKMLTNRRGFTSVTEHVTEAAFEMTLTRFPMTIAVLLLALSFTTCGSLGIFVAMILYLVKLFKIYEDLLEDLLKAKIANVKDSLSPMNFHFSCFMLWVVLAVFNVASLLHWTRGSWSFGGGGGGGGGAESQTQWDLSMYLCLLLLPTVAVLWQDFVPKMDPYIWKVHRYIFYFVGMASVLWGTHRLYVTAFLITFVFLTMSVCQLVSVMTMTSFFQNLSQPQSQQQPSTSNTSGNQHAQQQQSPQEEQQQQQRQQEQKQEEPLLQPKPGSSKSKEPSSSVS